METFTAWILSHAGLAHWMIFFGLILAGCNIPISADLLVITAAILAATVVPENIWLLYASILLGALFSAYIAYWTGRLVGSSLRKNRFFSRYLPDARLAKIEKFYEKYGLLTLIVGRFVPFGVRNAIFMTTGMSRVSFGKFALRDSLACFIWTASNFSIFYMLGQNYEQVKLFARSFGLFLFIGLGVTVIGCLWYKKRKKTKTTSSF